MAPLTGPKGERSVKEPLKQGTSTDFPCFIGGTSKDGIVPQTLKLQNPNPQTLSREP